MGIPSIPIYMLVTIRAQIHYAYGDSPYAKSFFPPHMHMETPRMHTGAMFCPDWRGVVESPTFQVKDCVCTKKLHWRHHKKPTLHRITSPDATVSLLLPLRVQGFSVVALRCLINCARSRILPAWEKIISNSKGITGSLCKKTSVTEKQKTHASITYYGAPPSC